MYRSYKATPPTWPLIPLLIVHIAIVSEELGKCSIVLNELSVGARLSHLPLHYHHNLVTL